MHVDDAVDGLLKLMESDYSKPVNLGNPYTDISILGLAHKVINLTHSNSNIIFDDAVLNDPTWSRPDITLAKTVLNWEAKIDLDNGIKSII
jgi:nucleoside-diphosphate-sugar epimerase